MCFLIKSEGIEGRRSGFSREPLNSHCHHEKHIVISTEGRDLLTRWRSLPSVEMTEVLFAAEAAPAVDLTDLDRDNNVGIKRRDLGVSAIMSRYRGEIHQRVA